MVEALLLSVDEPQLKRCLESISNQTVPFTNLVHINGMVPQSVAYNHGVSLIKDEWFMLINGDMCLYSSAVAQGVGKIEAEKDNKVCGHTFKVFDTFLQSNFGGVGLYRTEVLQSFQIRDTLCNDRKLGKQLKLNGWIEKRHGEVLGTHFDSPDEYQVFRRFFVTGLKYNGASVSRLFNTITQLMEKTGDPLYLTAINAMKFSQNMHSGYPGSHNVDFEKKLYEEFKNLARGNFV